MTKFIIAQPSWIIFLIFILFFAAGEFLPLGTVLSMFPFFIWVYALGTESIHSLPAIMTMSPVKFKVALIYAAAYSLVVAIFSLQVIMPYALPFHLVAMFCLFYSIYFVAKCMRSIELQRLATPSDWLLFFLGLWFFPVGVWFIQPRIQRIVKMIVPIEN